APARPGRNATGAAPRGSRRGPSAGATGLPPPPRAREGCRMTELVPRRPAAGRRDSVCASRRSVSAQAPHRHRDGAPSGAGRGGHRPDAPPVAVRGFGARDRLGALERPPRPEGSHPAPREERSMAPRARLVLALAGIAAVLLGAAAPPASAQSQTIKIGLLYDHTGPFSAAGSLNS